MANRLLLLGLAFLLTCPVAWAQIPAGTEFQVNSYTTSSQRSPVVASDRNGNFVVVWASNLQDGSGYGIFGQRFNAVGLPQGSEFQVNSYTTSDQRYPVVASGANGTFVVVWASSGQDGSDNGVFGQRFDAAGLPQGSEFQVNSYTTGTQQVPSVASDASGNFVVVWQSSFQDGSGPGVFGQRFTSAGIPQGPEFQVNSYTTNYQNNPAVASDANGNFVVVWNSYLQDGSNDGVFGQRFTSAGIPQGSEFQVNSYTTSSQNSPAVASDANGNFVVVWNSYLQDGSNYGVFGQRFNAAGLPQGSEFQINSYTTASQNLPKVASDTDGNWVVVWNSSPHQDGSEGGVFGQRFTASGVPSGSEFQVNSYTTSYQIGPAVASATNGKFVVVWRSWAQDGNGYGVFGQRFKGTPVVTWANPAAITYGTALGATQLNATADVAGTFIYAPAAGTVLNASAGQTLSVTFTPTDTTNYTPATKNVTIAVGKATPVVTWANPAAITYGTALGATQLNATAGVAGTFIYAPTAGTVLNASAGQTLSVTFTPTDTTNYTPATKNVTIAVGKATPVVAWANPAAITYGTALGATQLNATADVAGAFVYAPTAGTVLNASAGQTLSVTFTPTDTTNYTPATKNVTIVVGKATPVVAWANPASITVGTALSATQLNATASVGGAPVAGTFVYAPAAGAVPAAGTHTLSTTFTPTDTANYSTATGTVSLVVLAVAPTVGVSPATLRFAGTNTDGTLSPITSSQNVTVTFSSTAAVAWTAAANQPWVQITGGSGTGSGTFRVGMINPGNVLGGTTSASAIVTVTAAGAINSPQTVAVMLTLQPSVLNTPPIGLVDSPAQNALGQVGAIGVTGWVVDDVGIKSVTLYRNCLAFEPALNCAIVNGVNLVYVGDATIVTGARPDIEIAYPTYPQNNRAAWGYLLLTSMLPHVPNSLMFGGQGTLTLYVLAEDMEGHKRWLGRDFITAPTETNQTPTTFTMANDTIAKPFGAIDTPKQGETVSGAFWNFGWTLTPDSNTTADAGDILMPLTGATQWVYIDGVAVAPIGVYNLCRGTVSSPPLAGEYCDDDVSNIFGNPTPQPTFTLRTTNPTKHRNLDAGRGPIAAYFLDTTTLSNGVHTIVWGVTDSASRGEGIGSRYFTVLNGSADAAPAWSASYGGTSAGDAAGRDESRPYAGTSAADAAPAWSASYGGTSAGDAAGRDESRPYAGTSAADAVPAGSASASRSGVKAVIQDGTGSGIRRGGPPCPPDSRGATTGGCPDTLTRQAAEAALREAPAQARGEASALDTLTPATGGVWGRTGYDVHTPYAEVAADDAGVRHVEVPALGRLELWLGAMERGYLVANGTLRDLPPGSHLDLETGVFTWVPGVGYIGKYRLTFVRDGEQIQIDVTIRP